MTKLTPMTTPLGLDAEKIFAVALKIRAFEERLLSLFSQGELFGTVHTCIGQEFSGVAAAAHLLPGDTVVTNHRGHGHYIAKTGDVDGLMAEIMGRTSGVCGGRGGSQHVFGGGVLSNGIQGGMTPIAAGMALSHKLSGSGNIAVAFIGDGTLGEGVVYESLNIASAWRLPLLLVLENNGYAQSTKASEGIAGDICARASAFGITIHRADTWTPEHLVNVMGSAIARVRADRAPAFICVDTYRLAAHSKGDDNRPRDEVDSYWAKDPIARFEREVPEEASRLRAAAEAAVSLAVERARASEFCAVPVPTENVPTRPHRWAKAIIEGRERVIERINGALRARLGEEPGTMLLGEDIEAPYGGAFKATKDLSLEFPGQVRNTPISEAAIVGIGTGLALTGRYPICEIMFGDFLTLAADQIINHASKFHWMYNDKIDVPLVVRAPMGGRRGYGATHSQSLEKHFLGIPGLRVLAIHHRYDPRLAYEILFSHLDQPTLVIEHKTSYGLEVSTKTLGGFQVQHSDEDFPTTRISSQTKADITVVCYGGMLAEVEAAADRLFEDHDVVVEIICPLQIYPLNARPIVDSAFETGRLFVVEEGQEFCGWGAEVLAQVATGTKGRKPVVGRMGAKPHPIPSCKSAEAASLPGASSIVSACLELMQDE